MLESSSQWMAEVSREILQAGEEVDNTAEELEKLIRKDDNGGKKFREKDNIADVEEQGRGNDRSAEFEGPESWGDTPVHNAAVRGYRDTLSSLLDKGANVDEKNFYGDTPIHGAASHGKTDCVKLLLERGANIEERNENGGTPIHCAAEAAHLGKI